jgi:hypothetical protein
MMINFVLHLNYYSVEDDSPKSHLVVCCLDSEIKKVKRDRAYSSMIRSTEDRILIGKPLGVSPPRGLKKERENNINMNFKESQFV